VTFSAAPAAADWLGEFFPLIYESYWVYENVDDPADTYTDTVFEIIEYEGQPAVRVGEDINDHMIASNDGQTLTVFAVVEDGETYDFADNLVLSEFSDGSYFINCSDAECDTTLIRVWDSIDPALRSIYEIDPQWTDLILFASYDRGYDPNLHNIAVTSNLPDGVTPPAGAVTGLEWFQRNVGEVADRDVSAETGGLGVYYVLVEYWVPPIGVPDRSLVAKLHQNFPNPFNPSTSIAFDLQGAAQVRLEVFDLHGRKVRTLFAGHGDAGHHVLRWNGLNDSGQEVAAGSYVCRMRSAGQVATRKMTMIK